MVFAKVCVFLVLASVASANPAFWKNSAFDSSVQEMRSLCANDDAIACVKYKFMSFLDTVFKKDNYKVSDSVEVVRNEYRANEVIARGEQSLEDNVKEYIQSHDVTFKLPLGGSTVSVGTRNLDSDELDIKLKFSESSGVQEARKSKLKKIMIPILVFVLLKAITLIPLALGVLGLKAWNAMQLSFFSFVISVGLAIFNLCKKIAADNAHPEISAHGPWNAAYSSHYARSLDEVAEPQESSQQMAYNAYY